jgi:hypothetical protein
MSASLDLNTHQEHTFPPPSRTDHCMDETANVVATHSSVACRPFTGSSAIGRDISFEAPNGVGANTPYLHHFRASAENTGSQSGQQETLAASCSRLGGVDNTRAPSNEYCLFSSSFAESPVGVSGDVCRSGLERTRVDILGMWWV